MRQENTYSYPTSRITEDKAVRNNFGTRVQETRYSVNSSDQVYNYTSGTFKGGEIVSPVTERRYQLAYDLYGSPRWYSQDVIILPSEVTRLAIASQKAGKNSLEIFSMINTLRSKFSPTQPLQENELTYQQQLASYNQEISKKEVNVLKAALSDLWGKTKERFSSNSKRRVSQALMRYAQPAINVRDLGSNQQLFTGFSRSNLVYPRTPLAA